MTKTISPADRADLEALLGEITPVSDAEASVILGGRVTGKAYEVLETALVGLKSVSTWNYGEVLLTKQSLSMAVSLLDVAAMVRTPTEHRAKMAKFEKSWSRVTNTSENFQARLMDGKSFYDRNLHLIEGLSADLLALAARADEFAAAVRRMDADEANAMPWVLSDMADRAARFALRLRTQETAVVYAAQKGAEAKAERERIENDPQEQLALIAKRIESNTRWIAESRATVVKEAAFGEEVDHIEERIAYYLDENAKAFAKAQEWAAQVEDGAQHLANLADKMEGGEFTRRRHADALRSELKRQEDKIAQEERCIAFAQSDECRPERAQERVARCEAQLALMLPAVAALRAALAEIEPPQAVEEVAVETVEQPAPEAEAVAEAEEDNGNELAEGFFAHLFGDAEEEDEIQEEAQPETSEAALVEEFADWPSALHGMFTPALAEALRTAQETPEAAQAEEEDHITDLAACTVGGGFGAVIHLATPEPKEPDAAPLPAALFGTVIAVEPQGGAVTCNPYAARGEAEASAAVPVPAQPKARTKPELVSVDDWTGRTLALLDALSEEIRPPEPVQAAPLRIDLPPPVVSPTPAKPSLIRRLLNIAA